MLLLGRSFLCSPRPGSSIKSFLPELVLGLPNPDLAAAAQPQPQSKAKPGWEAGYAAAVAEFKQGRAAVHGAGTGSNGVTKTSSWFGQQRKARALGVINGTGSTSNTKLAQQVPTMLV
jgi:hypothetical protein